MKRAAAITSVLLSLLFIAVYGTCNSITAQRADVGTWCFAWERFMPFVPLMVIPYMSIDLFFVTGPFLCRSRTELRVLAQRIVFAILVAGIFFLALPLRFAFDRPQPEGWLGPIFQLLHGFDKPHNLFPSLHITLRTILADLYTRHTKGWLRVLVHVWFSLIGLSTVLTWQHHVVDVAGGFALASVCFYLFRESAPKLPFTRSFRIGAYYAAGAILLAGLALVHWPWSAVLLWPTLSLSIVAGAYWVLGPVIFRKANGRLPLSTYVLLGPALFGQYLSWLYYRRQANPWNEVLPGLWIGRRLTAREAEDAVARGVTAVLDVTAESSEVPAFLNVCYHNIQMLDLTAPTTTQLEEAARFISEHEHNGIVYIHCKVGYSRSAAAAGAFLMASGKAAHTAEAIDLLRKARPSIIIRPEVRHALEDYDSVRVRPPCRAV